jgi:hypothetical protein
MRLTLRTLLAYLDDILDPDDAHELGQKIEESEFAGDLVHRIRSVTRKLRLGAPKLSGKGMGLDPNTVAEYLDNTLPQDRVPDFEKVCLESDVHLAEVASCHQILTLVLGEPADVDPALRERMRGLLAGVEGVAATEATEATEAEPPPPPPGEEPPMPVSGKATPPDWHRDAELPQVVARTAALRDPHPIWRVLPVVGTLVVAFLLALVALIAIGPLDRDHPIVGRFFAEATSASPELGGGEQSLETTPADQLPPPSSPSGGERTDLGLAANDDNTVRQPVPGDDLIAPDSPAVEPGRLSDAGASQASVPPATTFPLPPDRATEPSPLTEPAPPPTIPSVADPAMPDSLTPDAEPDGADDRAADAEPEPTPPEPPAYYVSELHVLAQWAPAQSIWTRIATHDPIVPGEPLVALPTYRPQLLLASGLRWTAVGPAQWLHVDAPDDPIPTVSLDFGRFIAVSSPTEGARINVRVGARVMQLAWDAPDAVVAVEVRRYRPLGQDPQEQIAPVWVDVHAVNSPVRVAQPDRMIEPFAVQAGEMAVMIGTRRPELRPASAPPFWLDAREARPIDRLASQQLEPALRPNRSLTVSLQEQVNSRLTEVRVLAINSLALFHEFDPFAAALNDRELRVVWWRELFDNLQSAVDRSPETASLVRNTFERLRGDEGRQLYRMLWGYSPEQLAEGGAEALVESLSSPSLDRRVLAFLNLYQITEKTNAYQPEVDPKRQRRSISNWERDLRQGDIRHRSPPLELILDAE